MKIATFHGGIHPADDGKALTKEKAIRPLVPKKEMSYPLSQHIGAPAKPVVSKGDRVLAGQLIAEAGGFVSAPIYSTVSGTVRTIEPRRTVSGAVVDAIIIENDGQFEEVEWPAPRTIDECSKEEIRAAVQKAGVVGMGGAGFPTHVKLSPKEPDKIDYVIANCAECEPYLTSDYRRLMEEPEKVVAGMKLVLKLFDNAKGVLAIEDNKLDCAAKLRHVVEDEPNITVQVLKTKYPQGSERQLIYAVTKRALTSDKLPADMGCIVQNVDTLYSINRAVCEGKPLMHRVMTITGDAVSEPANLLVPIGTDYSELIEAVGGFRVQPEKIISGGPMMGNALFDLHVPVMKTSSAVLTMSKDLAAKYEPSACIKCGRCVDACPEKLVPSMLADESFHDDADSFVKHYGMECVECGSCTYVCPARRHLAHAIKSMKRNIMAERRQKAQKKG